MSTGEGKSGLTRPVIAILGGTGKEGTGLAMRWAAAGYKVIIGSRQLERAEAAADTINQRLSRAAATGMQNEDAARQADICVLTVVFAAHRGFVESLKEMLEGKILVDATSRVDYKDPHPPEPPAAAQQAQEILGSGVRVVAAFQNVPARVLAESLNSPLEADVLVCGDDINAVEQAIQLANEAGLKGYYAGKLANAIVVESMTAILISMNKYYKVKDASIRITGIRNAD
jgi:8-hydroxy-5-deazaflavin:NADPH oxidoreductase